MDTNAERARAIHAESKRLEQFLLPDGVRLRADGKPLTIRWRYSTQFTEGAACPALAQQYWSAVGVKVVLEEISTASLPDTFSSSDSDMEFNRYP